MKQFTNKEQTHHLVELGFPRPKSMSGRNYMDIGDEIADEITYDYSIGELIEFLPNYIDDRDYLGYLCIFYIGGFWQINYDQDFHHKVWQWEELIDALYEVCVELKNEGVI